MSIPRTQAQPQMIPLSKIHELPGVFNPKPQDKTLGSMVLSIESNGVKEAVILRQRDDGEYQLLHGDRRRRASELAKKQDIPAHVYEMTMQEAITYRKPLPLSRYTVREVKAPANYGVSGQELTAYLEHAGEIVRFEVTNKALSTGVSITKTGPKQAMAGQPVNYTFSSIGNNSNVMLMSFYWRDTLPAEVRLDTVVTGTYNFPGRYKITYRVNGGEPRTLADNLSTQKNYTLAASSAALGLASNERVTEIMFVFGQAPAGFAQVEKPMLKCS